MAGSEPRAFDQTCPIRDVLDRIGDQWSLLVLEALDRGPTGFNALLRDIGDISRQMLSTTLKRLEMDGFIDRTVRAEVPLRVEYSLTDLGRSFLRPLRELIDWANTNHATVVRRRRAYADCRTRTPAPNA